MYSLSGESMSKASELLNLISKDSVLFFLHWSILQFVVLSQLSVDFCVDTWQILTNTYC